MRKLIGWAVGAAIFVLAMAVVHQGLIVLASGEGGVAVRAAATCASCHGGS